MKSMSTMKPLNVLSVDWDYLVNATEEERLEMFPDGGNEDLPQTILDLVWSSRYAQFPDLSKIQVDFPALKIIKKFIQSHKTLKTQGLVTDSHKYLYDMVSKAHKKGQPINLINIDHHHDCYGSGQLPEIDCGNWMIQMVENRYNRLVSPQDISYTWIKREDSDCEEFSKRFNWGKSASIDYLNSVEGFTIDLLFICRSGVWSPPHLDKQFIKFVEEMVYDLPFYHIQPEVAETRYTDQFVNNFQIELEFIKMAHEQMKTDE